MIYGSADPIRVGGVGLLVGRKYASSLKVVTKISGRLLLARFHSNPELSILSAYAPMDGAYKEEKDKGYLDRQDCIYNLLAHNLLIVAGKFNARVGLDSHRRSPRVLGSNAFHDITNDNGDRLVNIYESLSLRTLQLRFLQPRRRQWM